MPYPFAQITLIQFNKQLHTLNGFYLHLPVPGYMVVPAGGGGTFLGGFIVKKLNLRCRGIIRFCMLCAVVSLMAIFIFLVHCPNVPMAGVTAPYYSNFTHNRYSAPYRQTDVHNSRY